MITMLFVNDASEAGDAGDAGDAVDENDAVHDDVAHRSDAGDALLILKAGLAGQVHGFILVKIFITGSARISRNTGALTSFLGTPQPHSNYLGPFFYRLLGIWALG